MKVSDQVLNTVQRLQDCFAVARESQRLANQATKKGNGVSATLLAIAQDCNDMDMFMSECAAIEKNYTSQVYTNGDNKGKNKKVPRCWTQAKSNIKAAHTLGLDVRMFATESAMRKEVNNTRKANKVHAEQAEQKASMDVLSIVLAQIDASFDNSNDRAALAAQLEKAVKQYMVGDVVQTTPTEEPLKAVNA